MAHVEYYQSLNNVTVVTEVVTEAVTLDNSI